MMLTDHVIQVNLFSAVILWLIYTNMTKRNDFRSTSHKYFIYLLFSNLLVLIFDILMSALNGRTDQTARILLPFVTLLFFIATAFIGLFWLYYSDYLIHKNTARLEKIFWLAILPAAVNTLFAFISLFSDSMFIIDADNVYSRGRFFYINIAACYAYMIVPAINIIANRSSISRNEFIPMLLFAVPPFITGILNTVFPDIIILWASTTLSMLIVFIFIQSKALLTDHLTGLFNKREFDNRFAEFDRIRSKKKFLAAVILDLDNFKIINDKYGHDVGDKVLVETGRILTSSFSPDDFICRIGGDEFAVIFEVRSEKEVDDAISKLHMNAGFFNARDEYPFRLSFSLGKGVYYPDKDRNLAEFFAELDKRMYAEKNSKKKALPHGIPAI
ncbi:MAG: diguanylate cyclase [Saccharofermentanales bacterium]